MNKFLSFFLIKYDPKDKEQFLKAKFVLITTLFVIFILSSILIYSSYLSGLDNKIIITELFGFVVFLFALVMLVRGNYNTAIHTIFITGFAIIWIVLFVEPNISMFTKLDTIVFVVGLLAAMPLMFFKSRRPMFFYFLANMILFIIFNFYLRKVTNLTKAELLDYFFDNSFVIIFVFFISFNLFSIYQQALLSLKKELEDRRKAEKALQESENRLSVHLQNTPVGAVSLDLNSKVTGWNPAAERMFGYTTEETIGIHIANLIVPEDYKKEVNKVFQDLLSGRGGERNINDNITKTRDRIICDWYNTVLYNVDGEVTGVASLVNDITERKKAEGERIREQIIADEREKLALVGQVAGKMAHDFNNVLGIIMGNTELSLLDCKEVKTKKTLELIYKQTIRGKNLTKNLVAFAKDQEPKQEFFNISEKINLVIDLLKKDLEGTELIKEGKLDVPEVLADPGMIEHALVNLIQNAIHATSMTEHPKIFIRTYSLEDKVCFDIEDNGCGIPSKYLEQIFAPSFTLKGNKDFTNSYKRTISGTGYGMANVKKYIDVHKGNITIDTKVGSGTVVKINLPIIKKELSDIEKKKIRKSTPHSNNNILLVEDEQAISDIQYQILTQDPCNHKVDIADNVKSAIDLFDRNTYDFVSLDYFLQERINGMDVYNHIRETNKTIPILFISGNIEFLESIKALKQKDPYIDHLSKPCKNIDYINGINNLLEKLVI